jgi:hypothetical protein
LRFFKIQDGGKNSFYFGIPAAIFDFLEKNSPAKLAADLHHSYAKTD